MGTRGKFLADMVRTSEGSVKFGLFRLATWIDFNFNCGTSSANCEDKKVFQCKLCVTTKDWRILPNTCFLLLTCLPTWQVWPLAKFILLLNFSLVAQHMCSSLSLPSKQPGIFDLLQTLVKCLRLFMRGEKRKPASKSVFPCHLFHEEARNSILQAWV